jgi:hypothetical protein
MTGGVRLPIWFGGSSSIGAGSRLMMVLRLLLVFGLLFRPPDHHLPATSWIFLDPDRE